MHYPDSRWRPRCQGKSRDDVSGRISGTLYENMYLRENYEKKFRFT